MTESITESERMELLLNYLTKLARGMVANGGTVEHAQLAVEKNAEAYHLEGVSCLIMNHYVSVCFHDSRGHTYMKQLVFQGDSIDLEKLRLLNNVSYQVCREHPDERELSSLLHETKNAQDLPNIAYALFQTLAITCICYILGGSVRDMAGTSIVAFAMFWIFHFLNKLRTDAIINNAIGMFAATLLAYAVTNIGIAEHVNWVIISESLLMIPGIPLVNAFQNLICGNELNGMTQMLRVILQSASLAAGTYAAVLIMGGASAW